MVAAGFDQFWADYKPEDTSVVPQKKKITRVSSQVSSMSSPTATSVVRGSGAVSMQEAARRRLKKYNQDQNNQNS